MTKVLSNAQGPFSVTFVLGVGPIERDHIAVPARHSCITRGSDEAVSPER
jgi:hypothetical protein